MTAWQMYWTSWTASSALRVSIPLSQDRLFPQNTFSPAWRRQTLEKWEVLFALKCPSAEICLSSTNKLLRALEREAQSSFFTLEKHGEPLGEFPGRVSDFKIFRQQEPEHRTAILRNFCAKRGLLWCIYRRRRCQIQVAPLALTAPFCRSLSWIFTLLLTKSAAGPTQLPGFC